VEKGCKEFQKLNKLLEKEEKILENERAEMEEAKRIRKEKQDKVDSLKQRLAELSHMKEVRKEKKILENEMNDFLKSLHNMPGDVSNKTEEMKETDKLRRLAEIKVNVGAIKSVDSKSEDTNIFQAEKVDKVTKTTRNPKVKPRQGGDQGSSKLDCLNRKNRPQGKSEPIEKNQKMPCKSSLRTSKPDSPSKPGKPEEPSQAREAAAPQEAATPAVEGCMVTLGLAELTSLEWAPVQEARGDEAALMSTFLQAAGVVAVQEGRAGRQEDLRLAFSSGRLVEALQGHCLGASKSFPAVRAGLPKRAFFRPNFTTDLYPLILRGRSTVEKDLAGHKVGKVEKINESAYRVSFHGVGGMLRCFADPQLAASFPVGKMAIARCSVARLVSNEGRACLTEEQLCSVTYLSEGSNRSGYARAITLLLRHTKVKEVVIDANDELKVIFGDEEGLEQICREFFHPSYDSMDSVEQAERRSCLVPRMDRGRQQGKFYTLLTTNQDRLDIRDFSKFISGAQMVVVQEYKVLVNTKQLLVDILTDQAVVAKYPSLQVVNSNFWFKSDLGKWRPRQKAQGS